jgi:4-hydroxybenzoate polyprenyltransferase
MMFPPQFMLLSGIAKFYAVYFSLQVLASTAALQLSFASMVGALSIVLFSLLMRIYDELKDAAADIRLGRAGDPRYKDRPIVTGAVTINDLASLRWLTTAILIVINARLGAWPLIGFAVLFLVTWLSFKWFFWPKISRHLLLAFVTHNPVSLVFAAYILAVYAGDFGSGGIDAWAVLLLVTFWAPLGAWETSRKIRAPEDETDYETYSQIFGWKRAPFVPVAFILLGTVSMFFLSMQMGLGWAYPAVVAAVSLVPIYRCLAFRISPNRKTANIQPYVELYAVVMDLGLLLALMASRGVDLSLFAA